MNVFNVIGMIILWGIYAALIIHIVILYRETFKK